MAKRQLPWTESKIARYWAEGRGKGEGLDYKAWLTQHDIASFGNEQRLKDGRSGRLMYLFSDLEEDGFRFYDAYPYTVSIKEQFPLDRNRTRKIAEQLGIKHPHDSKTHVDIVMTTDLVVTESTDGSTRILPRSCKYTSDLSNFNQIEHAEIERRYWESEGCALKFLTERSIPLALKQNLMTLAPFRFFDTEKQPYAGYIEDMSERLVSAIISATRHLQLLNFCNEFDKNHGLQKGQSIKLARHLIYKHRLLTNLRAPDIDHHNVTDIGHLTRLAQQHSTSLARRKA